MDDFDFEDLLFGSSYVDSAIPTYTSSVNISDILGDIPFNYDQGDFYDFGYGDLSSIAGLGNIDFSGLTNYDQGDFYDFGYGDLGGGVDYGETFGDMSGVTGGIEGFGDAADQVGGSLSGISTDAEAQEGGFYGNTPSAYYDPRTNLTTLYNADGTLRDFVTHDTAGEDGVVRNDGVARIGGGSADVKSQPGGFYGNTPTSTYNPQTNTTTVRNPTDGSIRVIDHGTGSTTTYPPGTQPPKQPPGNEPPIKTPPPGSTPPPKIPGTPFTKDNALLIALLGGLLGLLGKGSAPKLPVGYQGGIPKYTSTRGQAVSPTAGGRRAGGAGIPSLTGGYTLTKAAEGGLMDLAGGGTARYLRGGTDGMADKIKTSIDGKQPARLSHGEFVIPADVVSHLGNGNSDAGADVLYEMMAKVRKARTGTRKQGKQINPRQYTPA